MSGAERVRALFVERFGKEPRVYSAPGRVNLIGEHTDYNDGFVLPIAIDRRTVVAVAPRDDRRVRCYSTAFAGQIEFKISADLRPADDWANHIRGMAATLEREQFDLIGVDLLIESEVPLGGGLGSSAALEVSVGFALLSLAGQLTDLVNIAETAQRAEQEFTGTRCGIMDQYIACLGVEGHALLIDCRSLDYRAVPVGSGDPCLVICDTLVRHNLAASEYNRRRTECETGVRILASQREEIIALRDVTFEDLEWAAHLLPGEVYRRCRHIVGENQRTEAGARALERQDFAEFGRLMTASHASLRVDYEVSCRELDLLVETALGIEGVLGARMTGGGFGGCTVNLVAADRLDEFRYVISKRYDEQLGVKPQTYICLASQGVREDL